MQDMLRVGVCSCGPRTVPFCLGHGLPRAERLALFCMLAAGRGSHELPTAGVGLGGDSVVVAAVVAWVRFRLCASRIVHSSTSPLVFYSTSRLLFYQSNSRVAYSPTSGLVC